MGFRAMRRVSCVVVVLAAGAVAPAATSRPDGSPRGEPPALEVSLRARAESLVAAGVPGVVVLVRRGDETVRVADGVLSRRTLEPVRPTDRFRVGSLTKTYVATVVLQLVAEHRLGLQDTVERWLPGLVPDGGKITVQELLRHRSGLYDYWGDRRLFAPYRRGDFAYHYTPRQLVELSNAHRPRFAPGARFAYTNTGYVVLGLIVEAVTGHPLGVELEDGIFRPLHLDGTTFGPGPARAGREVHGYMRIGGRVRDVTRLDLSYDWASGAVVSTADDVADFYRALLTGRILPLAYVRRMTTAAVPAEAGYGFGIQKDHLACGASWGHAGDTPGFVAVVHNSLDGRRQAVAFMNMELGDLERPARRAFFRLAANAFC